MNDIEFSDIAKKEAGKFNLTSLRNDKSVLLIFDEYTTIAIPIDDLKQFCDFIKDTRDELADLGREDVSIIPLAEKKTDHFNLTSWKDCGVVYLNFNHTMITVQIDEFPAVSDFIERLK